MKLSEYKKRADEYTKTASEINRTLLLAGIAIVWLFKIDDKNAIKLNAFLLWPLLTLAIGLLFDFLQYVVAGFIWRDFYFEQEKLSKTIDAKGDLTWIEPDLKAPATLRRPVIFFYWAKISAMIVSYILLIIYLINKIIFL